jgi:gamma-glutamyltranspeptidase/glutathione hydrolase
MRRFVRLFLALSTAAFGAALIWPPIAAAQPAPAVGTRGMVSSAHPLATEAGLEILEKGGNAFDAAVAVAAALNVVEPMMSGMGGYGTILVHNAATGETLFLNCSGRIPKGVDAGVFRAPTPNYRANRTGPKAVSTPGNANAWEAMSRRFGKMEWAELFATPIRLADEGHAIGAGTASSIRSAFGNFPDHAKAYYGKDDRPLAAGERLVQKDLARSLRLLAEQGAGAIHGGEIGRAIDAEMRRAGSFLTLDDLASNEAEWWTPSEIDYRGYVVMTASPPATAWPSIVRLGMMSRFDNKALGHNSIEYLHRFAEVTKHAFWCRLAHAGDPEINPPPLDRLLSEAYWTEQVGKIDMSKASRFVPPGGGEVAPMGENTTHFVVADADGNVVTATQTLGNAFGSRLMAPGTGIWLNNSLAYCTFEPAGNPMDAHAGRRKLSGDCPTIVMREGKPWIALGTPGGHTIGQTTPQMVMNVLDFGMDIQAAIAAPRVSFVEPNSLAVERGVAEATRNALAAMGHEVTVRSLGNGHGLTIEYGPDGKPARFLGGADPRGNGLARGRD